MGGNRKVLESGENISTLAEDSGLLPETIWNDAQNRSLREKLAHRDAIGMGEEVYLRDVETKKLDAATEKTNTFRMRRNYGLTLRLDLDPANALESGDRFTLSATDGSYGETRTPKDDLIKDDQFIDLHYSGLDNRKSYSLKVSEGDGASYMLFENVSYQTLARLSEEQGVDPEGATPADEEVDVPFAEDDGDEE